MTAPRATDLWCRNLLSQTADHPTGRLRTAIRTATDSAQASRPLRLDQNKEVRGRLGEDVDVKTLVDEMYDDVDPVLRHAAEQSTRTALKYLAAQN